MLFNRNIFENIFTVYLLVEMNDFKIRTAIKDIEFKVHFTEIDTKVIDEMGLNQGSSIIDIAVINGSMMGYEIKSDHDTLKT